MSFKRSFFKNLLISGGYTYLSQIINLFASFITSRLLLPSDFGLIGLITVFSGFITVFSDSGITMAVIRSGYQQTYYRGLNAVSVVIGVALCFVSILLVYPISLFYKNPLLIWPGIAISFLFLFRSLNIVPTAILQKKLQFTKLGKIVLFSTIAATLSTIFFAYAGFKYWSLIISQFVNTVITFILLTDKIKLKVRKPVFIKSFRLARTLIGSLTGFNIINYWARNSDNLIVGKFYGTTDLGIYNRAYLMLQLPLSLISGLFTSVLFPSLSKHKKEGGDVQSEFYFILRIISIVNLPVALILIIFPKQFVNILWGKNWLAVADLLPYFGLLVMIQTLLSPLGNILVLEKKEKSLMIIGGTGAMLLIIGIIYGATISLNSIAAFYSLSFIVLVLPLNVFYGIKKVLGFTGVLKFWIPKIFLCLILWIGIYNHLTNLLIPALIIWIIIAFFSLWQPIIKLFNTAIN